MYEQKNSSVELRFTSSSVLSFYQLMLDGAQSLYTNNRDFLSLPFDDRSILLHNTLTHTGSISSNFICNQIQLLSYNAYYDTVAMIASPSISAIARRFAARLNFDMNVMKLFLAIFSFSTFRYTVYPNTSSANLSDVKEVLRIQNRYIELTWRFLIYICGEERAVTNFSNFIRCIFVTNEALVEAQELQWFTGRIDSIAEKTEEILSLND